MISLGPLKREDMSQLLEWRNQFPEAWRDPRPTTITQQYEWFDNIVSKSAEGRYWGVYADGVFVGQVELTSIIWEYGIGEIGLIVDPSLQGKGIGREAVRLAIKQAFEYLRLETVCGECYYCNDAWRFWRKIAIDWGAYITPLRNRKRWDNRLWDALYFSWHKEECACLY